MKELTIDRIDPTVLATKRWRIDKGGAVVKTETTPSYYILYVKTGVCRISLEDGRLFRLRSDDIFFFPPKTTYTVQYECTPKNFFFGVWFDMIPNDNKALFAALTGQGKSDVSIVPYHFTDRELFNRVAKIKPLAQTNRIFDRIYRENEKKQAFCREIMALHLHTVLLSLLREEDTVCEVMIGDAADRIIRYVHEHVHEKLTNESVAEALTYHPNYINNVIKQATSMTFHQYVVDVKLHVAMDLLLNTQDSVTDIAQSLSFCTSSHFGKLFFKTARCTPSQFRKRYY